MARAPAKRKAAAKKAKEKGNDVPPPIPPASTNSPASKKQPSPRNKNLTQTSSAPTSPTRNTRSNTNPEDLLTPKQPPKIPTTDTGDDDAHEMDNARQTDNATTTDVNQDGVTTAAKPASASVTPTKSPPSNGDSPTQDYDEDSSVEEITKVQVELPPPSINDNASFEDLFPFVTNKSQVSSPNKGNPASKEVFLETYKDFKAYLLGTKQNKMPSIQHKKSIGQIYIARDGTSSGG